MRKKTAVLFEGACSTASILSGAKQELTQYVQAYGYHLGMAFQLVDDVLDYAGTAEELGKNIGDDLAEGKPTLPLIYSMSHGSSSEKSLIEESIRNGSNEHLEDIISIIKHTGALDYTANIAQQHVASAIEKISTIEDSSYRQAMIDLAKFSISRSQ